MSLRKLDDGDMAKNNIYVAIVVLLEDAVLVVALFVTLVSLIIIIKGKKFHPNLRILFINQFFGNICFILVRLTVLINTFNRNKLLSNEISNILESIRAGLLEFFTVNLIMILLERSQSTIKAAEYENYFAIKQSIILIVSPWIITIIIILVTQFRVVNILVLITVIFGLDFVALFSFVFLFNFNKRKLHEYTLDTTLSKRFQIQENILTMRFLAILCFTYSIYLLISLVPTFFFVSANHHSSYDNDAIIWAGIFDNITAINCLISSLVFLLPYRRIFKGRSSKISMTNIGEIQRQIYFEQLRKQWT